MLRSDIQLALVMTLSLAVVGCSSRTNQATRNTDQEDTGSTGTKLNVDGLPELDMWTAAAEGNVAIIQAYIDAGADLNEKEPEGEGTPLIVAAFAGQLEVAELLVDNGASLSTQNHDGSTPLHVAAFFARPDMVKLLLSRGADPLATNDKGQTPLESIDAPWTLFTAGYYRLVAKVLQVELDLERIKRDRPRVCDILRAHQSNPNADDAKR